MTSISSPKQKPAKQVKTSTRFFQVTFWFPKWMSLSPWKRSLKTLKKVTRKNLAGGALSSLLNMTFFKEAFSKVKLRYLHQSTPSNDHSQQQKKPMSNWKIVHSTSWWSLAIHFEKNMCINQIGNHFPNFFWGKNKQKKIIRWSFTTFIAFIFFWHPIFAGKNTEKSSGRRENSMFFSTLFLHKHHPFVGLNSGLLFNLSNVKQNPDMTFHEILIGSWGSSEWLIPIPMQMGSIIPYIRQISRVNWTLLNWNPLYNWVVFDPLYIRQIKRALVTATPATSSSGLIC